MPCCSGFCTFQRKAVKRTDNGRVKEEMSYVKFFKSDNKKGSKNFMEKENVK